ncbi:hypothetical protein ACFYON_11990 [Micromonospora sp. NPDC005686]|uniref:hypothetical protein n=1 Tax=unclassified Micromonospora TaxID=2617518 RepID=UPI0033ADBC01
MACLVPFAGRGADTSVVAALNNVECHPAAAVSATGGSKGSLELGTADHLALDFWIADLVELASESEAVQTVHAGLAECGIDVEAACTRPTRRSSVVD